MWGFGIAARDEHLVKEYGALSFNHLARLCLLARL